jgi:predicted PurR-regulated permease PerM
MRSKTFERRLRIKRKLEKVLTTLCSFCLLGALIMLSIGSLVWSVQWVLKLVGVM